MEKMKSNKDWCTIDSDGDYRCEECEWAASDTRTIRMHWSQMHGIIMPRQRIQNTYQRPPNSWKGPANTALKNLLETRTTGGGHGRPTSGSDESDTTETLQIDTGATDFEMPVLTPHTYISPLDLRVQVADVDSPSDSLVCMLAADIHSDTRIYELPFTTVSINGNVVQALLDSGSAITTIHERMLTDEQKRKLVKPGPEDEMRTFTDEVVTPIGYLPMCFIIADYVLHIDVLVVERCRLDCIIGFEVIKELERRNIPWIDVKRMTPGEILEEKKKRWEEVDHENRSREYGDTVALVGNPFKTSDTSCIICPLDFVNMEKDVCNTLGEDEYEVRPTRNPFLVVRVNGYRIEALVDTGSTATMVSDKYITVTDSDIARLRTRNGVITATNGYIPMAGVTKCKFFIAGQEIMHETYVAKNFKYPAVIGMDLLTRLRNVSLDLAKGCLVKEGGLPVLEDVEVFLTEHVTVDPRTEVIVPGKVYGEKSGDVLFEPYNEFIDKYDLPVTCGVCCITEHEIPIRMVNSSANTIRLYPGTRVGTAVALKKQVQVEEPPRRKVYADISLSESDIDAEQKTRLKKLLREYRRVLAEHEHDLGKTSLVKHTIPLVSEIPIKQRAYRVPYAQQEVVRKLVKDMEDNDIIRKSSSPWTSPVVMVKKKDGSLRFCVDFRKLNEATRKDTYPLPRIDEMLDKLGRSTIFTTLDLQSGYWQIEVEEEDKPKTAFSTGNDLWEFNVLPFGLTGAPATFQRCMNFILMDTTHAMVYIDDIIVFSETFEEHLEDLREVLDRLLQANMKIKPTKCEFAKRQVKFLGHQVSAEGIQPDPSNIEKVKNFPLPRTAKEIQQFLGLASYYRRFIKNFAHIAAPLHELVRKEIDFEWTPGRTEAFNILKERLINPPILRYPDFENDFLLMTDASGFAIGAVLGQKDDKGTEGVIAFASRSLKTHEKNYSTIEREALAIVFATKQFRHYIWMRKVILLTDQRPLVWLMKHKDSSSRLIRWALQLQEYNIEIHYRAGKANGNADCLSRIGGEEPLCVAAMSHRIDNDQSELKRSQEADDEILRLKEMAVNRKAKGKEKGQYVMDQGILYYRDVSDDLLVIPAELRAEILLTYHDGALGGHLSKRKTYGRIRRKYFWPGMEDDVKEWIKRCQLCATRRDTGVRTKVPLKPIPPPLAPMELTAMDVLGPLPLSRLGNKYIIVFSDYFTRWVEAYPMIDQKAETIAQIFVEKIVFRYGVPRKLLTDQGTNFLSDLLNSISKIFEITRIHTSPYHPQTDGLVERFNRTLAGMLSTYTNKDQDDWDVHIPYCLFAYRNAPHATTGETPFYLMYLRHSGMPEDIKWIAPQAQYLDVPDYKITMMERMKTAWDKAGLTMKYQQETMKEEYDRKTKDHKFEIGDRVLIHHPFTEKGLSHKLKRPYKGPYRVLQVTSTNLKLRSEQNKKAEAIIVHVNRCKLAPPEEPRYPLRNRKQRLDASAREGTEPVCNMLDLNYGSNIQPTMNHQSGRSLWKPTWQVMWVILLLLFYCTGVVARGRVFKQVPRTMEKLGDTLPDHWKMMARRTRRNWSELWKLQLVGIKLSRSAHTFSITQGPTKGVHLLVACPGAKVPQALAWYGATAVCAVLKPDTPYMIRLDYIVTKRWPSGRVSQYRKEFIIELRTDRSIELPEEDEEDEEQIQKIKTSPTTIKVPNQHKTKKSTAVPLHKWRHIPFTNNTAALIIPEDEPRGDVQLQLRHPRIVKKPKDPNDIVDQIILIGGIMVIVGALSLVIGVIAYWAGEMTENKRRGSRMRETSL